MVANHCGGGESSMVVTTLGFWGQAIRWRHSRFQGSKGCCHGNHFLAFCMGCILAPPGEYDWTVHVRQRCGHMSNYFERLFKMAAAAILDCYILEILRIGSIKRVQVHCHSKFCGDQSNRCWNMAIFWFFNMAAATVLDFRNADIWGWSWKCITVPNFVAFSQIVGEIWRFFDVAHLVPKVVARWPS